jgi:hypothetical protein
VFNILPFVAASALLPVALTVIGAALVLTASAATSLLLIVASIIYWMARALAQVGVAMRPRSLRVGDKIERGTRCLNATTPTSP